jgi:methionyl-tRNA formyltransferase
MRYRIVFMGSPKFALPIFKQLFGFHKIIGVVTQPDRLSGRGRKIQPSSIKVAALEAGIEVIQPQRLKGEDVIEKIHNWNPDVIVVAAFGQILSQAVLDIPKHGCLNVHASLLPRWRGASPVQAAILHGDGITGITIMQMDAGLDTGPILSQCQEGINPNDTAVTLSERLSLIGAKLLIQTLPDYINGNLNPVPQDSTKVTYAPMIKKEEGLMNFHQSAIELERKVRAYQPWPGTFFIWKSCQIKIIRAAISSAADFKPNENAIINKYPAIGTSDGLLVLEILQPPGKKPMPGNIFLNGVRDWV